MVIGTGLAVATVMTGGAAALAGAGIGITSGAGGATVGSATALGTAAGIGASGGAIAGAGAAGTAAGAALGAAAGTTSAAGVFGTGFGFGAAAGSTSTAGVFGTWVGLGMGPVGWIALGAAENGGQLTFDCWKPVLHDSSPEPSKGMLIRDIVSHPNIAKVTMSPDSVSLPRIVLENVWQERFEIQYFVIQETGQLVAHAEHVGS